MKSNRDKSWTIALCASLAAHAVLAYLVVDDFADMLQQNLSQPGVARVENRTPIYLPDDNDQIRADVMGEEFAAGFATATSPGERSMKARQADADQPLLSRDPVGPGFVGDEPSQSTALRGDGGTPGQSNRPALTPLPLAIERFVPTRPFGIRAEDIATEVAMPARTGAGASQIVPPSVAPPPIAQAPVPDVPTPPAPQTPQPPNDDDVAVSTGTTPGVPQPAADPAPMSDSESDPFSKIGTVDFTPGAVEARFGRKVKTTRPRLTLAGKYDLLALQYPTVILKVETDETGKVTSVEILKSSGSNEIDQPCQVAIYDWWIEPPKNKDGNPVADLVIWKITWHRG